MAQEESIVAWIMTAPRCDIEPNYFYRLRASHGELVRVLTTAGFQLAPYGTLSDDGRVRVGFLSVSRRHPNDIWCFGGGPHHYYLEGADLQATIDALLGVELQLATCITDAVEGALGERWDIRLS